MSDPTERIIGELKEFKRSSDKRFDRIEEHLETLKSFRWKALGASGLVAALVTVGLEYFRK